MNFPVYLSPKSSPRPLIQTMPPHPATHTHEYVFFFFTGGAVFVVLFIVLLLVGRKCIKKETSNKIEKTNNDDTVSDDLSAQLRTVKYFTYRTLKNATSNFKPKKLLGKGGFGAVYKGVLDDGRIVAVKQLSVGKSMQGESQFLSEVKVITNIQHKNLVRLIGCCAEGQERLLVYEFMENKSLDFVIFENKTTSLCWNIRFQIILGIARGLQYLHEDSLIRIIHRDIKASNILLDDKFQPKISDFGIARFFPEDKMFLSTTVAGTLGYTAPEYAIRGELSEKADIYSFGVLVLEIISCRKNTDLTLPSGMQYLPEYAWKLYKKSKIIDIVDPKLRTEGSNDADFIRICHVALLCLQSHANLRPAMSEIVSMLICKTKPEGFPIQPAFW